MISEAVTAAAMQVRVIFYVCLLVSIWGSAAVFAIDIPALVQKAKPAIVEIVTLDQQNNVLKTGTGFFISPDGMLLTNYHVISGGSSIMAKTPSGAVYFFKSFVNTSETYDVAELQFVAMDVPYLTLGSSSTAVEGQRVLVIGNPEGLEGTVSDGIISAFRAGRTMIQITAPVSPGSSGSPVLDESGNVIGVATQVSKEGQNLNFAISAETIRDAIAKSSPKPTSTVARASAQDYSSRAWQKESDGNWKGAIADFTEAIGLTPNDASLFVGRADSYSFLKEYSNAVSDYTEAIRLWPIKLDDALTFSNRGRLYKNRGDAYSSLEQYSKANSDYAEAVRDYTEAIRLRPDGLIYSARGDVYANLKLYRKAIGDYTEAVRIQPNLATAYYSRGKANFSLKQYSRAIDDYTTAIRVQPDDAVADFLRSFAYGARANAYDRIGNHSLAEQDRTKAKGLIGR